MGQEIREHAAVGGSRGPASRAGAQRPAVTWNEEREVSPEPRRAERWGTGAMGESEILVLASSHLQPELVSPGETYKWVLGKEARPVPDVHDCVPSTKLGVTAAL